MIWHSSDLDSVISQLNTNINTGLSSEEAAFRLDKINKKIKINNKQDNMLTNIVNLLKAPYLYIVLVICVFAVIFNLIFGVLNIYVPFIIIALTLLKVILSGVYDYIVTDKFNKETQSHISSITVIRNSNEVNISSKEVVPGDIILLKEGTEIPADARLITANSLHCDEYNIIKSDVPSEKDVNVTLEDIAELSERKNMVYAGSFVVRGSGTAVVTEILDFTEDEKLNDQSQKEAFAAESRIEHLSNLLNLFYCAVYVIVFIMIFVIGLVTKTYNNYAFLSSLTNAGLIIAALIVCISPNTVKKLCKYSIFGTTLTMKKNGIRFFSKNTISDVANLQVICADKTGTFTQNKMMVTRLYTANKEYNYMTDALDENALNLIKIGALCCDGEETTENGVSVITGDGTQAAIITAALNKFNTTKNELDNIYPRMSATPFNPDKKIMTTVNIINNNNFAIVRGAVEEVAKLCNGNVVPFIDSANTMSKAGLRTVAVAVKQLPNDISEINMQEIENNLEFLGVIGLTDVARLDSRDAVVDCIKAGIKVVMLTGDNKDAASAIAANLYIERNPEEVITGKELDLLTDQELTEKIANYSVFAEVESKHRERIVTAFKQAGFITAVTGDSDTNSSALRIADIGFSAGKDSDIAIKESQVFIKDNGFACVIEAIRQCKGVFNKISKSMKYFFVGTTSLLLSLIVGYIAFGKDIFGAAGMFIISIASILAVAVALTANKPERSDLKIKITNDLDIFNLSYIIDILLYSAINTVAAIVSYIFAYYVMKAPDPSSYAILGLIFSLLFTANVLRKNSKLFDLSKKNVFFNTVVGANILIVILLSIFNVLDVNFGGFVLTIIFATVISLFNILIKKLRQQ